MNKINFYILFILILFFSNSCFKNHEKSENYKNNLINKKIDKVIDLQDQLHLISDRETSSVVSINSEKIIFQKYYDLFDFFFKNPENQTPKEKEYKQTALGSGIIYKKIRNTYYIITNYHIIEKSNSIKITTNKKKTYKGTVIGSDPNVDIAVVKLKTNDNLKTAKLGNSDFIKVGNFVVAVGNPFSLNFTMTFGIISAVGRSNVYTDKVTLTDFIQTDTAINPGNSGGPLLNIFGEVIGINTLIYSSTGENIGIGFAVPINIAKETADLLIKHGKIEHGFLGVYYKELTEEDIKVLGINTVKSGMLITEIFKNSAAEKYGLNVGDIIVKVNDNKIEKTRDLALTIGKLPPGTKIKIKVLRDNKFLIKEITLGKRKNK
jgi:serine protease Do